MGRSRPPVLLSIWRYRRVVIAVTVAAALIGLGASQLQPVRYEATAEMLLTDPRDAGLFQEIGPRGGDPARYVRNQAQRVTSSTVAASAADLLEGSVTTAEVRERVRAVPSTDLDLITVTASGPTAEQAAAVANAVVQAYEDVIAAEIQESAQESIAELEATQAQLQSRVDAAEQALSSSPNDAVAQLERDAALNQLLTNQQLIERITIDVALYGSGVRSVERAAPPESPAAPRTGMNTAVAALLGLGSAAGVAVWRADALRRADQRHEPAEVLAVPLLGAIPDLGQLSAEDACPVASASETRAAEAFRFAAAAIEHALTPDITTIVVTSAQAEDGKTTVALNLASALHGEAREVLLVDADVRVHGMSRLIGLDGRKGLTDLSDDGFPLEDGVHLWQQGIGAGLPVVPAGSRQVDATQFFRSPRYRTALHRLTTAEVDLVVIDAPPLLAVSDASAIAGSADGIVLVVNRGTSMHVLADLQERLEFVGTPVIGYVFNRTSTKRGGYGYGYGYGTGPHRSEATPSSDAAARPTRRVRPPASPGRTGVTDSNGVPIRGGTARERPARQRRR